MDPINDFKSYVESDTELEALLRPLNKQQYAFLRAYLKHGNGRKAMEEAGYAHSQRNNHQSRMMKNPKIAAVLNAIRRKQSIEVRCGTEETLKKLLAVYEAAMEKKVYAPAVSALHTVSKIMGHYQPDDSGSDESYPLTKLSQDEFARLSEMHHGIRRTDKETN